VTTRSLNNNGTTTGDNDSGSNNGDNWGSRVEMYLRFEPLVLFNSGTFFLLFLLTLLTIIDYAYGTGTPPQYQGRRTVMATTIIAGNTGHDDRTPQ
jgi:hypothetical protein